MATRTDLLHAYQFRTRRVLAALVVRETDPRHSPLRRGVGAVFAGIMVTVLAGAGFGIYGLISKVGGDSWRTPGSVVVERETGASYVYLNDTLYPTLNLASAMLAGGQPNPTVHRVASASLTDVARGNPIGISGAPDSLPAADRRIGLPWTVCAGTEVIAGRTQASVALAVGVPATGGQPLDDDAALVREPQRDMTYLVWHGHRYLVRDARTVLPALFGAATPVDVGAAWVNAIPAGMDIAPVPVDRRGQPSRAVAGHTNGEVLVLQAETGAQQYLVLDEGLAPLTRLQAAVLNAQRPSTPITVTAAFVGSVPTASVLPAAGGTEPPAAPPSLLTLGQSDQVCATTSVDSTIPSLAVAPTVTGLDRATPTRGVSAEGTPLANRVLVPAGRVAVIRAVAAADSPAGSYLVVTDIGIGFAVPDADVLPLLGYSAAQAVDIPAPLAALLPAGPILDRDAALTPAAVGTG